MTDLKNEDGWRQVSATEFYKTVGQLDVQPRIMNNKYPYWENWYLRSRPNLPPVGRSVGIEERGIYRTEYYVPANERR